MAFSQNGYRVVDSLDDCKFYKMPNGGTIPLRRGPAGRLLAHFARRFHTRIENLNKTDCHGYNKRIIAGSDEWSNHASGTAIDLNATKHQQGRTGTFNKRQLSELRKLLAEYEGLIKWGGDYRVTKDEMHFEIETFQRRRVILVLLKKLIAREG